MYIQDQIEVLLQKQEQLGQEVDEALSLRNELSQALGNEGDVHDDLLSFLDTHSPNTHMQE
ncbi:hypothetical protein PSDVSF_03680 [Pseudodesulfovibrio sediminis]|uniref:Uncharacterized protein n=1 Tax=Pseudodesulfovibrio sediminis TaxID=2810563 RepID=A0ABN6EPJ7_9BACT|nr:hypothetical protein PSDVSF_03680 [Pseudodesulfovibrio sediminis]